MTDLWPSGAFFQVLNTAKASSLGKYLVTYDAPLDPLVGWGAGHPLPISLPHNAFGVSISALRLSGPQHKFLATPMRFEYDTMSHYVTHVANARRA